MENKKQDVNSLEELVKIADSYKAFFASLADEISKVLADIKTPKQEDTWKMECPYEYEDEYYYIDSAGSACYAHWDGLNVEEKTFKQGNMFQTKQAAELESKRRNLLTRFKAFRNECNGDWKPDWKNVYENKYFICKVDSKLGAYASSIGNSFAMFGYFKNSEDCERAIKLFGDEIIELYVEGE